MGFWSNLSQAPCRDFANGLTVSSPPVLLPPRRLLLASLFLICLVPRAWIAHQYDVLWADSVHYLEVTQALEKGDFAVAFKSLSLNTYPVILMWLRRTGLDWTVVGTWWSLLMGSLAVLPLFGWFRRMFDDRVATVACLLYAIHPKLVGYCPLVIRDPTYWLLFSLSLYLMWRAMAELRFWLFPAAGLVMTLAAYTRSEGWLLLVPLVLWSLIRWTAIPGRRARLVLGTVVCMAMIPASVALVNVTWLHGYSHWEWGRGNVFKMVWSWAESNCQPLFGNVAFGAPPSPVGAPPGKVSGQPVQAKGASASPPAKAAAAAVEKRSPLRISAARAAEKTAVRFVKALTYGYGLLILVGMIGWRHVFFRRDQQALFLQNMLLFLSILAYQQSSVGIDLRYFLSIVLIGLPFIALGLLRLGEWTMRLQWQSSLAFLQSRPKAVLAVFVVVWFTGVWDTIPCARGVMVQQSCLGRWILEHEGPHQAVLGSDSALNLVAYYAQGKAIPLPDGCPDGIPCLLRTLQTRRPKVFFVWNDPTCPHLYAMRETISDAALTLGYEKIPSERLPAGCRSVELFVRERGTDTARRNAAGARR
jgi:hypothetical protein